MLILRLCDRRQAEREVGIGIMIGEADEELELGGNGVAAREEMAMRRKSDSTTLIFRLLKLGNGRVKQLCASTSLIMRAL